jgi:hypothetical protein
MRHIVLTLATVALLALPSAASAYTVGEQWPTWGNTQFWDSSIADCTFAAAANWETVALHHIPSEPEVIAEFHAAGGNDKEGIELETYKHWWAQRGIGGVRATLHELPGDDVLAINGPRLPVSAVYKLKRVLNRRHALIWENSDHVALLVGYNATGPLLVSYGELTQMTWQEWRSDTWGVYVVRPLR